jgi:flagellar basal-body rod protein FlgC
MPDFPRPLALLPLPQQQAPLRPMFRALGVAASGLSAQRQRIETIAGNLANAETTRTESGGPYRRKVAVLQSASPESQQFGAALSGMTAGAIGAAAFGRSPFLVPVLASASDDPRSITVPVLPGMPGNDDGLHGVRVAGVAEDATEGPLVYDPGHPDADANGYVRYPNVRVTDEMIDMMDARRIYDANATVFQSAKAMLKKALEI